MRRRFMIAALLFLEACSHKAEQNKIAATFNDPDSVEFKNFHVTGNSACGFVNAKNGFGAYVGFQPFVVESVNEDTVSVDFGPTDPINSMSELKSAIKDGDDACRAAKIDFAKSRLGYPSVQCGFSNDARMRFKTTQEFIDAGTPCGITQAPLKE